MLAWEVVLACWSGTSGRMESNTLTNDIISIDKETMCCGL